MQVLRRSDLMDIDIDIEALQCVHTDLFQTGLLLGCEVDSQSIRQKGAHFYEGEQNTPGTMTWLIRCTQDQDSNRELTCNDKENQSMLLKHETMLSAHEYARNKVIVALEPTDLLIVE